MNTKRSTFICGLSLMSMLSVNADTVLIDSTTRDGGFESGAIASSAWGNSANATRTTVNFDSTSVRSGIYALGLGTDNSGTINVIYQNTGYEVGAEDTFTLDFWALNRYGMDADDAVVATLYTTDDNLETGIRTVLATYTADGLAYRSYGSSSFGGSIKVADLSAGEQSAVVGQELFVEFTTITDTAEYARVDDVSLTVIPEPATIGLVAAFGGGILFVRRRLIL